MYTPPSEMEEVTSSTPHIASSSPGMMDVSPLPHKAPFFVSQVTLPSPSPEETPDEDESLMSPDLLSPQEIEPTSYSAPIYQAPTFQAPTAPTFLALPELSLIHI